MQFCHFTVSILLIQWLKYMQEKEKNSIIYISGCSVTSLVSDDKNLLGVFGRCESW